MLGRDLPALSERSGLRFAYVFLGYVAQGLPWALFIVAIPAWLAADGASPAAVGGYVGTVALPWTLKFFNGFFMDRYTYLPMGRRRAWLIGAQLCMIFGMLACAFVAPGVNDIAVLAAFGFAVNMVTTFQDVAIDGMAVDLIPDEERARANGLMFGGQNIGIAIGGAGGGFLLAGFGSAAAMLACAGSVGLLLVMVILFRERPGEKLLPWSDGSASAISQERAATSWPPLIRAVVKALVEKQSLIIIPALILQGSALGIVLAYGPILAVQQAGWSDAAYSSMYGTSALIAGLLGAAVFGWIVDRSGIKRSAMIGFSGIAVLTLIMITLAPHWSIRWVIIGFVFGYICIDLYLRVSMVPTAMRLCDPVVAATQFTLYMALYNFGSSIGAVLIGPLEALGGGRMVLGAIVVFGVGGTLLLALHRPADLLHVRHLATSSASN